MEQKAIAEVEVADKRVCPDCEQAEDDLGELEPIYECSSCGERFSRSNSATGDGHQCPGCNMFAGKEADEGCPDCAVELEERKAYTYNEEVFFDTEELAEAIKDAGEGYPGWLNEELAKIQAEKQASQQKQEAEKRAELEFRKQYPCWIEYAVGRSYSCTSQVVVIKDCAATGTFYNSQIYQEQHMEIHLKAGQQLELGKINRANATANVQLKEGKTTFRLQLPLASLDFAIKPKYKLGQVFEQIDLSSRGGFNKEYFQRATLVGFDFGHYGDGWRWAYILKGEDGKTERLFEDNFKYQTGQVPAKEYCHCPNKCGGKSQLIHYGETCPECGFTLGAKVK